MLNFPILPSKQQVIKWSPPFLRRLLFRAFGTKLEPPFIMLSGTALHLTSLVLETLLPSRELVRALFRAEGHGGLSGSLCGGGSGCRWGLCGSCGSGSSGSSSCRSGRRLSGGSRRRLCCCHMHSTDATFEIFSALKCLYTTLYDTSIKSITFLPCPFLILASLRTVGLWCAFHAWDGALVRDVSGTRHDDAARQTSAFLLCPAGVLAHVRAAERDGRAEHGGEEDGEQEDGGGELHDEMWSGCGRERETGSGGDERVLCRIEQKSGEIEWRGRGRKNQWQTDASVDQSAIAQGDWMAVWIHWAGS